MAARRPRQEADPELLEAFEQQRARERQGPAVRRVARQWADGLRTVLGATGAVGIFGAPIAVGNLDPSTRVYVGVSLALVVLCGLAGLLLVMSAAYGGVRQVPVPTGAGVLALRALETQRAIRFFRWGRAFTVASFLLIAVAIGWAWMAPAPRDDAIVVVTTGTGVERCGALVSAADDQLGLEAPDGRTMRMAIDDVVSIVAVSSCPAHG